MKTKELALILIIVINSNKVMKVKKHLLWTPRVSIYFNNQTKRVTAIFGKVAHHLFPHMLRQFQHANQIYI